MPPGWGRMAVPVGCPFVSPSRRCDRVSTSPGIGRVRDGGERRGRHRQARPRQRRPRPCGRSGRRASSPSGPRGRPAWSSGTTRGPGRPADAGGAGAAEGPEQREEPGLSGACASWQGSNFPLPLSWIGVRCGDSGTGMGRAGPVPRRFGSGAAKGRARLPLTSQVDAVGGSASSPGGRWSRSSRRAGPAGGQPLQAERQAGDDQAREPAQQAGQARRRRGVARDRQVRPALQDRFDHRGQDRPRPHLDEDARPVAVHRLDHVGEVHGVGEVLAQPRGDGGEVRPGRARRRYSSTPAGRAAGGDAPRPAARMAPAPRRPSACGRPMKPAACGRRCPARRRSPGAARRPRPARRRPSAAARSSSPPGRPAPAGRGSPPRLARPGSRPSRRPPRARPRS